MKAIGTKRSAGKAAGAGETGGASPSPGRAAPDGSSALAPGLVDPAHAASVGGIVGAMPHVEARMTDLVARLLGVPPERARVVLGGIASDRARLVLLQGLVERAAVGEGRRARLGAAIRHYAQARRMFRAYGRGLWYSDADGRAFLAAPAGDEGAAIPPALREVTPAEFERERARLAGLHDALAGFARPSGGSAAERPSPAARAPRGMSEAGRRKRAAPAGESGVRGRKGRMRPVVGSLPGAEQDGPASASDAAE